MGSEPRFDELVLLPEPTSVGRARRAARAALQQWGTSEDLEGDALVVVSELVTNAVLHTDGGIAVDIALAAEAVRVRVQDSSSEPPRPRPAPPDATSGRGLGLVEDLARDWGVVDIEGAGKAVWFEVATAAAVSPSS